MSAGGRSRLLAGEELVRFAAWLATSLPPRAASSDAPGGERHYEIVWADESVNAWLIRWSGGSDTGFHDHDTSAAGIVVVEGILVEERLALGGPPVQRRFSAGDSFGVAPSAIHRVRHGGGRPALSLHAYSPPLATQGVYRVAADGALERERMSSAHELRAEPAIA